MGAFQAEQLKAAGLNPRTGKPYARPGGAYNKQTPAAKAAAAALQAAADTASKTSEKKAADKQTIAELRGQIATLTAELKAEKDSKALAVAAAKLEVEQKTAMLMLQRYQEGLAAGASLASGRGAFRGSPAFPGGLGLDESPP